jgi:hypothetical protein
MKKLVVLLLIAALLLTGYVAAGPFLAMRGIRAAVEAEDTRSLDRYVDFALLRASVRAQLEDYVARRMDEPAPGNPLRTLTRQVTGQLTGGVVDMLVTPAGIGALLQGRSIVQRAMGLPADRAAPAAGAAAPSLDPLAGAEYRYESASRFVATVQNADGVPIDFVFTRNGLHWRVTDMRLPIEQLVGSFTR